MANSITLVRLLLVFVIGAIALYASPIWQLLNAPLIITGIALDGLDGMIARARNETTVFGAVFDIAADRIIEITLWIVLAHLGMVSIWIAIIFLTRGVLVDSLRKHHSDKGKLPFSIMQTFWGEFLVASRTMRFLYGLIKLITFAWLFFLIPALEIWPQIFVAHYALYNWISNIFIYSTVIICLIRGIPVIFEAAIN